METALPHPGPHLPAEAVGWLCGGDTRTVLVHGTRLSGMARAGFADAQHDVCSTPDGPFRAPDKSVDLLLIDRLPNDLDPIARALRPGGQVGLISTVRDQRIPWARKLDRALDSRPMPDPVQSLITSSHFGFVGEEAFRHWQPVNHVSLEALVRAELGNDDQRERKVAAALELYADYGRGADGMQLPWLTTCYRATVLESFWTSPRAVDEPTVPIALAVAAAADTHGDSPADPTPQSTDSGASYDLDGATPGQRVPSDDLLLIDFR